LNFNIDPHVVVEDRQLAVLTVLVVTTMKRLTNAQWRGQATVAKAESAQGQIAINQKVAAKMFKYYFKCNILNITRLRRKEQGAAVCGCNNSGNGIGSQQQHKDRQWWPKPRQCKGRQQSTKKR